MDDNFRISLRAARVNAELTQDEAAQSLGITRVTLIKWENGETVPTADKAELISSLYKCPLSKINFCRKGSIKINQ